MQMTHLVLILVISTVFIVYPSKSDIVSVSKSQNKGIMGHIQFFYEYIEI